MKKILPWLIAIIILIFLVARIFYRRVNRLGNEANWYISQLHYDFSAKVDSIVRPGRALISISNGNFETQREKKLQRELKYHGVLRILIPVGERFDIRVPGSCVKNDSLYINSTEDRLMLFRNKKLIVSRPLSTFLRRKPF
jgi:hypothetical protein